MEMKGEQLIPAPQQVVWDALNDPGVLKACVPGCKVVSEACAIWRATIFVAVPSPVQWS